MLDAQTGEPRWTRDDIDPQQLAVGPDGSVYATALSDCVEYAADAPTPNCANPDFDGAGLYVITPEAVAGTE